MNAPPPNSSSNASTRREFLARTSAIGAVATVAGTLALTRAAHAGGEETLKLAIIGCGGRGTGAVAQALSTAGPVKLWAMADAFADRMKNSLASLNVMPSLQGKIDVSAERQFVGLDAYRHAIDSGADVILIAGPPGYRPLHFEYAVNAGKHVFMEKPVATDAPGVRRVLAAAAEARRKGLKVGVGLQRHHDPVYVDLVKRLQDGAIGDITFYRCYWDTAAPAKQPVPHSGLTELEYQVRNWYFFNWLSGDHIVEQHIHNLDVCNWIQQARPVSAQGMGGRQVREGKEYGNIYDHHFVEYTYANGAKMFSQCRQIPGCMNSVAEFAHGTRGWSDVSGGRLLPTGAEELKLGTRSRTKRALDPKNPFQLEHNDLFHAIRNGQEYNEAENGAYASLTAILGRMATYSGKLVSWDEALASQLKMTTDAEDWNAAAPVMPDGEGFYAVAVPGLSKAV
jgi:myo-inositol 2-dehydrogenase/D-chiro-inositol 1-dehydrogenase